MVRVMEVWAWGAAQWMISIGLTWVVDRSFLRWRGSVSIGSLDFGMVGVRQAVFSVRSDSIVNCSKDCDYIIKMSLRCSTVIPHPGFQHI